MWSFVGVQEEGGISLLRTALFLCPCAEDEFPSLTRTLWWFCSTKGRQMTVGLLTVPMSISLPLRSQHPKAVPLKHFTSLWCNACAFGEQVTVGQQAEEPCSAIPVQDCILLNFPGDYSFLLRSCAPAVVGHVYRDTAFAAVSQQSLCLGKRSSPPALYILLLILCKTS